MKRGAKRMLVINKIRDGLTDNAEIARQTGVSPRHVRFVRWSLRHPVAYRNERLRRRGKPAAAQAGAGQ